MDMGQVYYIVAAWDNGKNDRVHECRWAASSIDLARLEAGKIYLDKAHANAEVIRRSRYPKLKSV